MDSPIKAQHLLLLMDWPVAGDSFGFANTALLITQREVWWSPFVTEEDDSDSRLLYQFLAI